MWVHLHVHQTLRGREGKPRAASPLCRSLARSALGQAVRLPRLSVLICRLGVLTASSYKS